MGYGKDCAGFIQTLGEYRRFNGGCERTQSGAQEVGSCLIEDCKNLLLQARRSRVSYVFGEAKQMEELIGFLNMGVLLRRRVFGSMIFQLFCLAFCKEMELVVCIGGVRVVYFRLDGPS